MNVRRANERDCEVVRALRLQALLDAPAAFGSTYEREAAFPRSVWSERLGTLTNATFICEADDVPCGMVAVVRDDDDAQLGWLVGMWVAPSARGTGAADGLVVAALRWAEQARYTMVRLHVTEGNGRAERLYRRQGFSTSGHSFARLRDGVTEIEMERGTTT